VEQKNIAESVEKYRGVVFRVALGYVKNRYDADDIAQNVFLKLYNRDEGFPSEQAEKAWLIRVTVNEAKNLLKSAWFKRRAELDESLTAPEQSDTGLYEHIKSLKPKYRTVIYLYYYEGYTSEEVAGILEKPCSTIRCHLREARNLLRGVLENEER